MDSPLSTIDVKGSIGNVELNKYKSKIFTLVMSSHSLHMWLVPVVGQYTVVLIRA